MRGFDWSFLVGVCPTLKIFRRRTWRSTVDDNGAWGVYGHGVLHKRRPDNAERIRHQALTTASITTNPHTPKLYTRDPVVDFGLTLKLFGVRGRARRQLREEITEHEVQRTSSPHRRSVLVVFCSCVQRESSVRA